MDGTADEGFKLETNTHLEVKSCHFICFARGQQRTNTKISPAVTEGHAYVPDSVAFCFKAKAVHHSQNSRVPTTGGSQPHRLL